MFPISFVLFRQARKDDQERSPRERRIDSRGMEAPIRARKTEKEKAARYKGIVEKLEMELSRWRQGETVKPEERT